MINSYLCLLFLFLCVILPTIRLRRVKRRIRKNKKNGVKKIMPVEMIKDFIGKKVSIFIEGELGGFEGTILSVEGNWLKVEEKKHFRLINGDMVTQIRVVK